uniref:Uncharacterized protein n=1 Tax=Physcomitrium patens TaxID=3218 RepID=A0A7I4FKY5_PHYPA
MGDNEKTPLLKPENRGIQNGKDVRFNTKLPGGTDLEVGDAVQAQNVGFGRILKLARPEAFILCLATVALFVSSLSNVLLPTFAGRVIDIVTAHSDTDEGREAALKAVNHAILLIVVVVLVGSTATMVRAYLFSAASERVVARLKKDLFSHLIAQEIAFFDVTRTGELLNRLSEDTQVIKNAATTNLSETLRSLATSIIGVGFMLQTSWHLTALALIIVPAISLGIRSFGKYLRELSHKTQAAAAVAASIAEESFGAVRTVRSFANEEYERSRYAEKVNVTLQLGLRQSMVVGLFSGGVSAAATLSIVAVVVYGARLTILGQMTTGTLTAFILYSLTVGLSLASLSGLYSTAMKAAGASRRVFQLLDRVSSMSKAGDAKPLGKDEEGEVKLENVWFSYPSRPKDLVLKGVNLTLKPGAKVALVGPSGGGKISIVSQEPTLFNCSIAENISYGLKDNVKHEDIERVSRMANAHEFVSKFPEGYETQVGERGVRLSGGQKQRIAIARALLMDSRVLLLDEATSALDAESEFLVQDAMDRLMKGRTVLVIAHRLSTVQSADTVAVIADGKVAEQGSHFELLKSNGLYAALVRRQLQGPGTSSATDLNELA